MVVTNDRRASLFAILFAVVPLLSRCLTFFTPSDDLIFLMPFLLYAFYLVLTKRSKAFTGLLVLLMLLFPYVHPEMVSVMFLIFLSFALSKYLSKYTLTFKSEIKKPVSGFLLMTAAAVFIWYSSFSVLVYISRGDILSLKSLVAPPVQGYATLASRSQLTTTELLGLLIKLYGAYLVYIILVVLIISFAVKKILIHKKVEHNQVFLGLLIMFLGFMTILSLFLHVVLDYTRVLLHLLIISTILIGIFFAYQMKEKSLHKNRLFFLAILVTLTISTATSIFSLYPSPITDTYNQQVTYNEVYGANWLVKNGSRAIESIDTFYIFGRFVHVIEGLDYSNKEDRMYAEALYQPERTTPDHFNYQYNKTLGESYFNDTYLLTNKLMKSFYFELWPNIAKFTQEDFVHLNNDPSVSKIYHNGEFETYYIQGFHSK